MNFLVIWVLKNNQLQVELYSKKSKDKSKFENFRTELKQKMKVKLPLKKGQQQE